MTALKKKKEKKRQQDPENNHLGRIIIFLINDRINLWPNGILKTKKNWTYKP